MQENVYLAHGSALRLHCDKCAATFYFNESMCVQYERGNYSVIPCKSCLKEVAVQPERITPGGIVLRPKIKPGTLRAGYVYYNDYKQMQTSSVLERMLNGSPDMVIVSGLLYSDARNLFEIFSWRCTGPFIRDVQHLQAKRKQRYPTWCAGVLVDWRVP